ncbi:hypothetical protein [Albidovulum sp.]|jgi:hypothetical protein|uniref:hypothetical protein n=1 Tax=Albidovulum sp. TaxID=1872424 RepID=UPI0039B822BE
MQQQAGRGGRAHADAKPPRRSGCLDPAVHVVADGFADDTLPGFITRVADVLTLEAVLRAILT